MIIVNDKIFKFKNKLFFLLGTIVTTVMIVGGLSILPSLIVALINDDENLLPNIIGISFMICWLIIIFWMFSNFIKRLLSSLRINQESVTWRLLFFKKQFFWDNIKDYGIVNEGNVRINNNNVGDFFTLYFSDTILKVNKKGKKKIKKIP